mmetsp:Transcript_26559/g.68154  ORF Transcript_26559/g.68154 Transcript_26559/m.68154 type:complete len:238 (+) Transcript_26559:871-1584(+)
MWMPQLSLTQKNSLIWEANLSSRNVFCVQAMPSPGSTHTCFARSGTWENRSDHGRGLRKNVSSLDGERRGPRAVMTMRGNISSSSLSLHVHESASETVVPSVCIGTETETETPSSASPSLFVSSLSPPVWFVCCRACAAAPVSPCFFFSSSCARGPTSPVASIPDSMVNNRCTTHRKRHSLGSTSSAVETVFRSISNPHRTLCWGVEKKCWQVCDATGVSCKKRERVGQRAVACICA